MADVRHEVFETNSIIRASAGTGKTYALATRFIRLMLIDGVRPETIVALTFSRAAAQEIYTKILDRLCTAAQEGLARNGRSFAENEWNGLLEDYRSGAIADSARKLAAIEANPPPHEAQDFARLLRRLVDTQHLGAIATLDSFILKIVRNFPKEMGVQNAISVLDPIDENAAIGEAVRCSLARTDGLDANLADAFARSQKGDFPRPCLGTLEMILARQGWRNFVLTHPECIQQGRRWTVASMAAQLGVNVHSVCPVLSAIPFNEIARRNTLSPEEKLVRQLRDYDGTNAPPFAGDEGAVGKMAVFFWQNPGAPEYTYTYYRREYTLRCGPAGAAALHGAIRHAINLFLTRQLEIVEAKIKLVEAVEREYERMTRRMGKLTFADFTSYSAEEEFSKRGIALKNVEFRFDSKFDHWALDEFQDTSELQWRCLKELVRNAAEEGHEGGNRTAMAVGDMKQSIYTWRGASARPFEDIASWEAFVGFERDFDVSHRYGPNIAAFVNRVFGLDNVKLGGLIPDVCTPAVEAWRKGWRDHVSGEAPDHVKVVSAPRTDDVEETDAVLSALHAEVERLWRRHRAEVSTDTVGILVRSNADGLAVAEYLRKQKLDVVWEGMNPCGDDILVQSLLALLKVSEHPSDSAAWRTVSELVDIRSLLLPECATCAEASAVVARLMAQQGLARTLKDWCEKLRASGRIAPGGRTNEKLNRLLELAVAFEARRTDDADMMAFADFVAKSGKREIAASSDVIRVLTIHRAKGLGLDHVFVPLFEGNRAMSAMDMATTTAPLFDGGAWVLSHLPKGTEQFNVRTKAAYERMRNEHFAESLRTYYVALTRAKRSMVVVVPEERGEVDTAQGLLMRDLIRSAVAGDLPYEVGDPPSLGHRRLDDKRRPHAAWPVEEATPRVVRISPSRGKAGSSGGRSAADLFDTDFGQAVRKGIDLHAAYADIEWIDPAAPKDELEEQILGGACREAFVRPSREATVWRERSYELFMPQSSTWETGQFDRVVFTGCGDSRSAVIYDFKTNVRRADESAEAFDQRIAGLYASQMGAYRHALHRLTGIPLARIDTRLLLVHAD